MKKKLLKTCGLAVVCIALLVAFPGCGFNPSETKQAVSDKYPNAEIRNVSGEDYKFIVRLEDGSVREVQTMNVTNTEITLDVLLFD